MQPWRRTSTVAATHFSETCWPGIPQSHWSASSIARENKAEDLQAQKPWKSRISYDQQIASACVSEVLAPGRNPEAERLNFRIRAPRRRNRFADVAPALSAIPWGRCPARHGQDARTTRAHSSCAARSKSGRIASGMTELVAAAKRVPGLLFSCSSTFNSQLSYTFEMGSSCSPPQARGGFDVQLTGHSSARWSSVVAAADSCRARLRAYREDIHGND